MYLSRVARRHLDPTNDARVSSGVAELHLSERRGFREAGSARVGLVAGSLMDGHHDQRLTTGPRGESDARASALADYLRERAAVFSLSADVMESQSTANAGMALLDAAHIADAP